MQLTNAEEQVMKALWKLDKAYLKNILDTYPEHRPATTTVVTLLKRMIDKGFVGYHQYGSNREYYPKVKKSDYFSKSLDALIKDFFNNSASQFASFFTKEKNMSLDELEELKHLIETKIEDKQQKE
jgi:BlaI family transcriptional regulator, penicillinase repressor